MDRVEDIPPGPLLLVANEFFDALPIDQFVRVGGTWRRRRVGLDEDGAFVFVLGEAADLAFDDPDGSVREICPQAARVAALLGQRLARQGGALLVVDYGYARSQSGDSLQAVKNHRFHPVLDDPGEADLTAHVDFQALAEAAIPARSYGTVGQGAFLKSLGIETRLSLLIKNKPPAVIQGLESGVSRLIDNTAMGALFKVMAITHPAYPSPLGFDP